MNIYNNIIKTLKQVEKTNNVKILFAIESGSRGWGFASDDSDYDCRFIYVNKYEHYLSIHDKKDVIEIPVDEVYDVSGWDLKKSLLLLKKSNGPLLEWISSPIVYMENTEFINEFRDLAKKFFKVKPSMYHYLNLANRFYEDVLEKEKTKIKSYFYIIRPLFACKYIMENGNIPPMEFEKIRNNIEVPEKINNIIDRLLEQKKKVNEKEMIDKEVVILDYIGEELKILTKYADEYKEIKKTNTEELDMFFRKVLKSEYNGL